MKTLFYRIEALTNLHAGSGDANYGVVDNLIQRDAVTDLPTVHGSSLKGALKEHFEGQWGRNDIRLGSIFGSSDNSGEYRFLSALLVAMPVRCNKRPYFMATCPSAIKDLLDLAEQLDAGLDGNITTELQSLADMSVGDKPKVSSEIDGLAIEDIEEFELLGTTLSDATKNLLGIVGDNLILMSDAKFKKIADNSNLPVIARNQLDNGKSKNLWYEQVLPRKSVLMTAIIVPDNDGNMNAFEEGLGVPVHIGANASVGYGYTKFSKP